MDNTHTHTHLVFHISKHAVHLQFNLTFVVSNSFLRCFHLDFTGSSQFLHLHVFFARKLNIFIIKYFTQSCIVSLRLFCIVHTCIYTHKSTQVMLGNYQIVFSSCCICLVKLTSLCFCVCSNSLIY